MPKNGPSPLLRLFLSVLVFVISSVCGGLVIFLVRAVQPGVQPALSGLLAGVPYAPQINGAFWALIPCTFGLVFSFFLTWLANRLTSRRKAQGG